MSKRSKRRNKPRKPAKAIKPKPKIQGMRATPERIAKAGPDVEPVNIDVDAAEVYLTERFLDPFERLRRRLSAWQYRAGKNLQELHDRGQVGPRIGGGLCERVDGSQADLEADSALHAKQEYFRRVEALGLIHRSVVVGIVIEGRELSEYRSSSYSDPAKAVVEVLTILRTGLDLLDRIDGGSVRAKPSTWTGAGSRPSALTPEQRTACQAEEAAMEKARRRQGKNRAA